MLNSKRILLPIGAAVLGMMFLAGLYFGIMSWAEGFQAAQSLFWADRWFVLPIIVGFGVQAALYTILRFRLFVPVTTVGPSSALMGASGTTSTVAMLACCVHHITDVLPILGLTAASAFLGQYRSLFMWVGLGTTTLGIAFMLYTLYRERRKAFTHPLVLETK